MCVQLMFAIGISYNYRLLWMTSLAPLLQRLAKSFIHVKARKPYISAKGPIERFAVPDDKVKWGEGNADWPEYQPVQYTDENIHGKVWADPDLKGDVSLKFNDIDGKVNRVSYMGQYEVVNGFPRNPVGRTGIAGRGKLGRWGPNHAADPIVTRWKRDTDGKIVQKNGKNVLQFVSICRKDTGEWAIPGGMVDPGEAVNVTLRREFNEEALAGFDPNERSSLSVMLNDFFANGILVYHGYVDDPRNTDNAWMETTAYNFHDENGECVAKFPLSAGDDAGAVRWTDIDKNLKLYASHTDFISAVAAKHNAHWD